MERGIGIVIAAAIAVLSVRIVFIWTVQRKIQSKIKENAGFQWGSDGNAGYYHNVLSFLEYSNHVMEEKYALQIMNQKAELKALQSQINPHFLYNTLDTIRGKAYEENAVEVADMAGRLALLFRYVIGQKNEMISIEEEIRNIENFIGIQEYRFNSSIELSKIIDEPLLLEYRIPKLTLQPIVENTFKYGFTGHRENNHISIQVFQTQNRVILRICDNGKGMSIQRLREVNAKLEGNLEEKLNGNKSNGIALGNVNERIKLTFGKEYGIVIYSIEDMGTTVELILPGYGDNHENRKTSDTESFC